MRIKIKDVTSFKKTVLLAGYSNAMLGRAISISNCYVTLIMSGKRHPSPKIAKKIIDALQVNFDDIFFIEEDYNCKQESEGVHVI